MKPECEQVRNWLDDLDRRPLAANLEAHAASCPVCSPSVVAEQALRDGLGAVTPLDSARRAAMIAHALAAPAITPRRASFGRKLMRWSWAPLAAAAAIVLVSLLAWPHAPRNPISPTELFGDFLGPMADLVPQASAAEAPAKAEPSTMDNVLATFWGDLDAPLTVAQSAMEAPRAAAGLTVAARNPKQ